MLPSIRKHRRPRAARRVAAMAMSAVAMSAIAIGAGVMSTPLQAQSAGPRTPGGSQAGGSQATANTEPTVRRAIAHLATKHGAWLALGGSRGGADLFCEVCTQDPTYAWSLEATVGIRLAPTLLLGVETVGWFDVFGGADRTLRSVTAVLRSHAFGRGRPYLTGGAGVARYRVREDDAGFRTQSPALTAGIGHDVRVGSTTVSPHVSAVVSVGGKLQSERTDAAIAPTARVAMIRTGLTLAWFR